MTFEDKQEAWVQCRAAAYEGCFNYTSVMDDTAACYLLDPLKVQWCLGMADRYEKEEIP